MSLQLTWGWRYRVRTRWWWMGRETVERTWAVFPSICWEREYRAALRSVCVLHRTAASKKQTHAHSLLTIARTHKHWPQQHTQHSDRTAARGRNTEVWFLVDSHTHVCSIFVCKTSSRRRRSFCIVSHKIHDFNLSGSSAHGDFCCMHILVIDRNQYLLVNFFNWLISSV